MSKKHSDTNGIQENVEKIADDTQALLAATVDVAEEKVVEARNRLTATLSAAKDTYMSAQKKAVEGAKAADKAIREKPYHAAGIAFVAGALLGYLFCRRSQK
jgi:ElaB/YqjD/DUF883 family membrane-anchored ribosome-binding protein